MLTTDLHELCSHWLDVIIQEVWLQVVYAQLQRTQALSTSTHYFITHVHIKNGMGSPDGHVAMHDIHLQRPLWIYCPEHAGVKANDRPSR